MYNSSNGSSDIGPIHEFIHKSNSLPALHLSLSGMDINKDARSTPITIWLKGKRYDRTNV